MTASAKRATPARKAAKRVKVDKEFSLVEEPQGFSASDGGDAAAGGEPTRPPTPAPEFDPDKAGVPDHPYGAKKVYVFRPSDGSAPIVFPHITEVKPTEKFFWRIYKLNEMLQSFEWMEFAEVPRYIQERVIDLGEQDRSQQADFFRGWFAPLTRPNGLEPPGES